MKKKILGVSALAGILLVSATGCEKTIENPDLTGKTLNVYVNYCKESGVTYTGLKTGKGDSFNGTAYTNPFDGQTYVEGDILPMWKAVQTNLGCTINDAVWDFEEDAYTQKATKDQWTKIKDNANFGTIDLLMTDSASASEMNAQGRLVNLNDYLEYMPNFSKFLEEHPTVASEMTNLDGELYMLPYFDGLDAPEKMFLMNTELVQWLLDNDAKKSGNYDTTAAKATQYQAFIDTSKDQKVKVSVDGKAKTITLKASQNPITRQNALAEKNGQTYVEALKAYIDEAYMPSGVYAKRSEVFTSESACYTVDDLIALMRCAVNNSVYLYGSANAVHGIIPRETKDSRIDSILYFAQAWGVRGLTSEKEYLYFDGNGKLADARTTAATYDALGYLHQLYAEGLIINGFEASSGGSYTAKYLSGTDGAALMMYDYNATQTVYNKLDENGIGNNDYKYNGIMPVLPPLTKWANNSFDKNALSRYTEDARSNKGSGTVIPTFDGKDEAQIQAACALADYFYGEEGGKLQDFGPVGKNETTGLAYTDGTTVIGGVEYPKYTKKVFDEINASGLGWNNYFRVCVGTTQGIGHVRSDAVDYQVTHVSGQKGLNNLLTAVNAGVVTCALTTRDAGFGAMVPSQWSSSPAETASYAALSEFWTRGTGDSGWRSVVIHGWEESSVTRASLEALWSAHAKDYLQHYQTLFDLRG